MFKTRTVVPTVGQGAFVYQDIEIHQVKWRIIFDCGSLDKSKLQLVLDEIKDREVETILILSHFHQDHINGVPFLKEMGFNIKKLIIPNYKIKDIVLFSSLVDDKVISNFILKPDDFFPEVKVIKVDENTNGEYPYNLSDVPDVIGHEQSYSVLQNYNYHWKLKFFVNTNIFLDIPTKDKQFVSRTNIDNFDNRLKRLRAIYSKSTKKIKYRLNRGSMLTASFCHCEPDVSQCWFPVYCYPNSILATGDFPIDSLEINNKIAIHYREVLHRIFQMTVPHHGGKGYLKFLPMPFIQRATIQAGRRYRHPAKTTLELLESWRINVDIRKVKD